MHAITKLLPLFLSLFLFAPAQASGYWFFGFPSHGIWHGYDDHHERRHYHDSLPGPHRHNHDYPNAIPDAGRVSGIVVRGGDDDTLQCFTGTLGGAAPAITASGDGERVYEVEGDTFPDFASAAQRTCDDQFNTCQEAVNANGNSGDLTLEACSEQQSACQSAQSSASVTTFGAAAAATSSASSTSSSSSSPSSSFSSSSSSSSSSPTTIISTSSSSSSSSSSTPSTTPTPTSTESPLSASTYVAETTETSHLETSSMVLIGTTTINLGPDPEFPDFDIICDA
ncbi:hypothetical protein K490DRAFT_58248 [Saccharata proteae CBS 121410]|uniref:Uncharacterized protein n=1 Tax=Saccharata proteae CBS 121410 TaxID=1314787 RepID=A0A9P4HQA3_9PEZI|nr:hypothetical protein K490DRAFT_58248 [Saccharata proteae CBS 121410]